MPLSALGLSLPTQSWADREGITTVAQIRERATATSRVGEQIDEDVLRDIRQKRTRFEELDRS